MRGTGRANREKEMPRAQRRRALSAPRTYNRRGKQEETEITRYKAPSILICSAARLRLLDVDPRASLATRRLERGKEKLMEELR